MAGLAEAPSGRTDEHEAAVPAALDEAEERARREKGRREVRAQRRLPALEGQVPDRLVLARPDPGHRRAGGDAAELPLRSLEQRRDLVLHGEVGLQHDTARLARELLGMIAARAVVDRHPRSLGREGAHTCRADPAGAAGHEDALPGQSRLHGVTLPSSGRCYAEARPKSSTSMCTWPTGSNPSRSRIGRDIEPPCVISAGLARETASSQRARTSAR